MDTLGRSQWQVGGVDVTKKVMPNGEKRTRIGLPGGMAISITEMVVYSLDISPLPWQNAHFHKGLTEDYLVLKGWAFFASSFSGEAPRYEMCHIGSHIRVDPERAHCVLLGPGTLLQTTVHESPIGNPEKKGNDWWPCFDFDARIAQEIVYDWFLGGLKTVRLRELDDIEYPR